MPFHVEIRRSFHRARAFNLSEAELRRLLEPWRGGAEVELGDRRWDPRESTVSVLEGPALSSQQLAFGQGWQAAVKSAADVTESVLHGGQRAEISVLARTEGGFRKAAERLAAVGRRAAPWRDGADAAIVVVGDEELSAEHAFTVGLALGTLGSRAILLDLGEAPLPGALRAYDPVGFDDAELAKRLSR